jgi:hypothetical protein
MKFPTIIERLDDTRTVLPQEDRAGPSEGATQPQGALPASFPEAHDRNLNATGSKSKHLML